MEQFSKKIKSLVIQIIPVLESGEEEYWLKYFKYILENFDKNDQKEMVKSINEIFKGGMGSFSDLVLQKNSTPLIEENNQLDSLKDKLFDACQEFLCN